MASGYDAPLLHSSQAANIRGLQVQSSVDLSFMNSFNLFLDPGKL